MVAHAHPIRGCSLHLQVELIGILGAEDELVGHAQMCALMAELDDAYKRGTMGGGSFRQCAQVQIAPEKVASKLAKLDECVFAVVVFCGAAKRDGVAKKAAKYNEKNGSRIAIAWTAKTEAYPVQA